MKRFRRNSRAKKWIKVEKIIRRGRKIKREIKEKSQNLVKNSIWRILKY